MADNLYDLTDPYEIARYIKEAEKQTTAKAYVNGDFADAEFKNVKKFGQGGSWILIGGRSGILTRWMAEFGIDFPSIYGFAGILLVLTLKLYPFIYLFVAGALKNIDSALIEAAESLGCSGLRKVVTIIIR